MILSSSSVKWVACCTSVIPEDGGRIQETISQKKESIRKKEVRREKKESGERGKKGKGREGNGSTSLFRNIGRKKKHTT